MCQSQSDGGRRCHSHSIEQLRKSKSAFHSSPSEERRAEYQADVLSVLSTPTAVAAVEQLVSAFARGVHSGVVSSSEFADVQVFGEEQKQVERLYRKLSAIPSTRTAVEVRLLKSYERLDTRFSSYDLSAFNSTDIRPFLNLGFVSPENITRLVESGDVSARRALAFSDATSAEILSLLAFDADGGVRALTGFNRNTPADALSVLARDRDWQVRACVAKNFNAEPSLLKRLSLDSEVVIRRCVAGNKVCPSDVLVVLSFSEDWRTRRRVSKHLNTPPETLARLAEDDLFGVRQAVARNKNTLKRTLIGLTADVDFRVRDDARASLGLLCE